MVFTEAYDEIKKDVSDIPVEPVVAITTTETAIPVAQGITRISKNITCLKHPKSC